MMVAHLTIAGLAEAVATAGIVAWLQRANPKLLAMTAGRGEARDGSVDEVASAAAGWSGVRSLWIGLGALMVLSPLGLLAAGMAWGEWGVEDLQNAEARGQIAQASGNIAPPEHVPQGLEQLSSIWTAPIPDYAPAFMHNASFGYVMSAVMGAGLILLVFAGLSRLFGRGAPARRTAA
jgi:cobalt/nickel transport system permease protein